MILTQDNYHSKEANQEFMSTSQYKGYRECEGRQQAIVEGRFEPEPNAAFKPGSMFHAWSEGPAKLAEFKIKNPDLYKKDGDLKMEFKIVEKMIDSVQNDPFCMFVLQGQKEVILTAELFGVQWKAMLDVYAPDSGRYVEIKTTKSITDLIWDEQSRTKVSFIEAYGYLIQAAVYLEIERIVTGRAGWLEPIMLAVSKEDPPDKSIISLKDDERLQYELDQIKVNLPRIIAVKSGNTTPKRCGKCDYCRSTKKIEKIIHYTEIGG